MFGISVEHFKIMVTKPDSELIKEHSSTDVAPEIWASAASRACLLYTSDAADDYLEV